MISLSSAFLVRGVLVEILRMMSISGRGHWYGCVLIRVLLLFELPELGDFWLEVELFLDNSSGFVGFTFRTARAGFVELFGVDTSGCNTEIYALIFL